MAKTITDLLSISIVDKDSDVIPIVDVSDTSSSQDGTTKKITPAQIGSAIGIDDKANIEVSTKTGVLVVFTDDAIYGSTATPETGNITANYTGSKRGVSILILHQGLSEPPYPAEFVKMQGSADYDPGKVNRIYATLIEDGVVDYSIQVPA